MSGVTADRSADAVCDRCKGPLDDAHRIRLAATHRGSGADRYVDAERRVCVDCLAAMGLLEFADGPAAGTDDPAARTDDSAAKLRTRLADIRSMRGGD